MHSITVLTGQTAWQKWHQTSSGNAEEKSIILSFPRITEQQSNKRFVSNKTGYILHPWNKIMKKQFDVSSDQFNS